MIYKEMPWYHLFLYTLSPLISLCYLKCFLFQRDLLAFSSQIQIQFEFYFYLRLVSFSFLCSHDILPSGKMLQWQLQSCAGWHTGLSRHTGHLSISVWSYMFYASLLGLHRQALEAGGLQGYLPWEAVRSFPMSDKNNPWLHQDVCVACQAN